VLDISFEESATRRAGRGADRIERAGDEFHQKVARAYRLLPQTEPKVVLMAGVGKAEEVHERVKGLLRTEFPETFGIIEG
jgi:thymidylate kinase